MSLEDKEILVTGCGFVGSNLIKYLLSKKARVTVMDRNLEHIHRLGFPEIGVIKTDLRHLHKDFEFDFVFHTAGVTNVGYAEANPLQTYDDNVSATLNLLWHVRARERFVFTSSAVVYNNQGHKHSEKEEPKPISLYGLSKVAGEELIKHFGARNKFNYTIFRFFNIYGAGQSDFFLIPQIINQALRQRKITLWNRTSQRDFIYIDDVIDGVVNIAQKSEAKDEIVNIGTGKIVSTGEIADCIVDILGDIDVIDENRYDPASISVLAADTSKSESLGFRSTISVKEGLEKTITAYTQNRNIK